MKKNYSMSDEELFMVMKEELFAAVISDVMDALELAHQSLPPPLRRLEPHMVLVGRAFTVGEADIGTPAISQELADNPFGNTLEALDHLKPHEVYICTGSSPEYALWGE